MTDKVSASLARALWKIYRRPERPEPWSQGGNLPWNEPGFSERMLREHLDESHGAASRVTAERLLQIDWLWSKLDLKPGARLLDVTCGPGLYALEFGRRGCQVTGIDFSPASIAYARDLVSTSGLAANCTFVEQDVRHMELPAAAFEAAILLYGQLAVFSKDEAAALLARIAGALRPGGRLCVELLNQDRVDKSDSTWWFTDNQGLWGSRPFLHLGERFWNEAEELSTERYYVIHLETGELTEISLHDQTYTVEAMARVMKQAGLHRVETYLSWENLPLYDADEWVVYIARK